MALHGKNGGPMCCLLRSGKWHAEHGRRRHLGRIVIRAMMASTRCLSENRRDKSVVLARL